MSETIEEKDYEKLYYQEKAKNKVILQRLDKYECEDLEREGFFVFKGYVKQQIDVLKDFKLSEEITKNPKDEKYYDRIKAIGEGLKGMISDLNSLRIELKISAAEEKQGFNKHRTSPESVANVLGNIAGQQS